MVTLKTQQNLEEIIVEQKRKSDERGDFSGRKYVEKAHHPIGIFGEQYCLTNPQKYPEII